METYKIGSQKTSLIEDVLSSLVKENFKKVLTGVQFDWNVGPNGGPMDIDIYIESKNKKLAIEYDGRRFHSKSKTKDELKNNLIKSHGIHLLRIRETGCYSTNSCDVINVTKTNYNRNPYDAYYVWKDLEKYLNEYFDKKISVDENIFLKNYERCQNHFYNKENDSLYKFVNDIKIFFNEQKRKNLPLTITSSSILNIKCHPKVLIGKKMTNYRTFYKNGTLTDLEKSAIEEVYPDAFNEYTSTIDEKWNEKLELYKQYVDSKGGQGLFYVTQKDSNPLYSWFYNQKVAYREGKLKESRINSCLDTNIYFFMDVDEIKWFYMADLIEKYFTETKRNRFPYSNEVYKNKITYHQLANWWSDQTRPRQEKRRTKEEQKRFKELQFLKATL